MSQQQLAYMLRNRECDSGHSVVILGAGCIGLTALLAAKAFGAADITVVDVISKRLNKALELGATRIINGSDTDVIKIMEKITNGAGVDVIIEAAGSVITMQQTAYFIKRGGTVALVGMTSKDKFEYNFAKVLSKEAQIRSVFRYRNIYAQAIKAVANGDVDIRVVTMNLPLKILQKHLMSALLKRVMW